MENNCMPGATGKIKTSIVPTVFHHLIQFRFLPIIVFVFFFPRITNGQVIISLLFGKKLNTDKIEFGLAAGTNYADISNVEAKRKLGLNLALYFNFKMSQDFFFHVEASPKFGLGAKDVSPYRLGDPGLDSLFQSGKVKRQIKYIGVPLMARYRVKGLFFVEGGPQINLRVNAVDEFEAKVNDQKLTYENKVKDQYTAFEIGLVGGLEWKFKKDKGLGLTLRYYQGLTNILKDNSVTNLNNAFQLVVFIPIGVGKEESKPPSGK